MFGKAITPLGEIETKVVLKAGIEACAAVAELKQCGGLIPNQAMSIDTIPVLEAQASSEIENIVTTADRLFQCANSPDTQIDAATKEALPYRKALYSGFQSLSTRPLTKQTAFALAKPLPPQKRLR